MPTRPPTHKPHHFHERAADDRAYNLTQRKLNPALWAAQQVRNSARWRRLRLMVLNTHPLCADPYGLHAAWGRVEPAVEVDHIIPLVVALHLAFDEANLQPLCTLCHSKKSARERQQHGSRASRGYRGRVSSD